MRERLFITGDTGSGKTRAAFSVIERVLSDTDKNVWYIACDDGHSRFLPRVNEYKVVNRFNDYSTPHWIDFRDAYRTVRHLWQDGDWIVLDRVDLAWESIREYFGAAAYQVSEDELDDFFLQKRMKDRVDKGLEKARKDITVTDYNQLDWSLMKSSYKGVVFDATAGAQAVDKKINVICTSLALPSSGLERDGDVRALRGFGMTVQGEKNVPSWFDTHILLTLEPNGYNMYTVKDRERQKAFKVQVPEKGGFVDAYMGATAVSLVV